MPFVDVEHELAVEQHLDAVGPARPSAASAASRPRAPPGSPGPRRRRRPSPCHFWNAITANRVCSPALPSTAVGGEEAEVGEPLLERAHRRPSDRSSAGRAAGRAAARRARVALARVIGRERDVAGEEPERRGALDVQPHRLDTADRRRRQHELGHAAQTGSPRFVPVANRSPRSTVATPFVDRDGARAASLRGPRSRPRGRARADDGPASSAATAWRSVEPVAVDVDDLLALEERDLHRRRRRARAPARATSPIDASDCRRAEPSDEIPHAAERIFR